MVRHLYAVRSIDAAPGVVRDAIWPISTDEPGTERDERVHELHVNVANWNVTRSIRIELGRPVAADEFRTVLELRFSDAQHPDLFPTFAGRIDLVRLLEDPSRTEIVIAGAHHPPLGLAGQVGDHLLVGRTLGPATVRALLDDITESVEAGGPVLILSLIHI